MDIHANLEVENAIITLRKGIQDRYRTYHRRDRLRFPLLEYNTNRTNYLPLRESFEEDFFVLRAIDRQQKTIHIPSTTTLSLLFTDDTYVPSPKILNTCWAYAEGLTSDESAPDPAERNLPRQTTTRTDKWLVSGSIGLLIGLLLGLTISRYYVW